MVTFDPAHQRVTSAPYPAHLGIGAGQGIIQIDFQESLEDECGLGKFFGDG